MTRIASKITAALALLSTGSLEAAQPAVRIMYGAAGMFVIAAVIEGFWSPHRYLPPEGKYAVGIVLWVMILLYFLFAGRGRRAA